MDNISPNPNIAHLASGVWFASLICVANYTIHTIITTQQNVLSDYDNALPMSHWHFTRLKKAGRVLRDSNEWGTGKIFKF